MKRKLYWLAGIVVGLAVLVVGGTWIYINVIKGDAPAKLSFDERDEALASSTTAARSTATTAPTTGAASTAAPATGGGGGSSTGIDGTWTATDQSQLGYRVKEVLFGQSTEGVGRTNSVTGQLVIAGTTVNDATFTVDLTTVKSDESNRDSQFRGRIMNTSQFPTATFTLTEPIDLGSVPADRQEVTVSATGDLTLRGVTKPVTFDLTARRNGANIEVNGSIPITFADWGIPNPSFGPASTEDHGVIEFLLVFDQA